MAVDANDIALRDFGAKGLRAESIVHQRSDISALLGEVVELEDAPVGLSAVGTGVSSKMVLDDAARDPAASALRGTRLRQMQGATLSEVRPEALPAPPLVSLGVAIKGSDREVLSTSSAPSSLGGFRR